MDALTSNRSTVSYSPPCTPILTSLSNNIHHQNVSKLLPSNKAQFQLHCKYTPILTHPKVLNPLTNQYTAVVDSGAGAHMTSAKELFTSLQMYYDDTPD